MGIFDIFSSSFKKEQEKELEKMLNSDIYDIKLSDVRGVKFNLKEYTKEEADAILLADYDKKSFQNELKRSIKPQALENMNIRLDGKTKEEVEKEREEEIKKKAKNLENPEALVAELEKEKEEESGKDKKDSFAIRSEAIKSVYMTVAKEYYRLVSDLQIGKNGQVYTGSIVNGTKMDNKIIMYQSYLRKLDLWYRNVNHGMPIGFDEQVKEIVTSEEYKKNKNDKITNSVRGKQVDRVVELQKKLDVIEDEMVKISQLKDNSSEQTEKLASLKKEYADKKMELATIEPSIGMLHAEYEEKERMEEFGKTKGLGVNDKYSARVVGQKNNSLDKKNDYIEQKMEKTTENVIHDELIDENLIQAEEALERFDTQFSNGEYDDAIQSLIVAKSLISTASSTLEDVDDDGEIFEKAKSESERLKEEKLNKERNNKMGIGATYSDDEILSKDVEAALKGIRDKVKGDIERAKGVNSREKDANERCR